MEVSGPPLGGLRAPKGTPKSLQGRGQYEANDLKLAQTTVSELKLHSSFPQGHWSSRAEAEFAKRKPLNHRCFVIVMRIGRRGVCAKTARKRQIGPNGLLASTACTFQRRELIITFGRSFKTCAPLRRETYFGSPGLYPCGRNGLLASTACTFIRRLLIIIFVRFFKTCAPLRREAYFGSPGLYP